MEQFVGINLSQLIAWIMSSTGGLAIVSLVLEKFSWFQKIADVQYKKYFVQVVAMSIAFLTYVIVANLPQDVLDFLNKFLVLVVGGVGSVGFIAAWHKLVNKK